MIDIQRIVTKANQARQGANLEAILMMTHAKTVIRPRRMASNLAESTQIFQVWSTLASYSLEASVPVQCIPNP